MLATVERHKQDSAYEQVEILKIQQESSVSLQQSIANINLAFLQMQYTY